MISLAKYFYNYFAASPEEPVESDERDEEFLTRELLNLELENAETVTYENDSAGNLTAVQNECFERTGSITYLADSYGLIDGMMYFEKDITSAVSLLEGEKVRYLAQKTSNDDIKVVKIIQSLGPLWDEEVVDTDEKTFTTKEHTIIGQVDYRDQRIVAMKQNDVRFSLDDVISSIVPTKGDWLELTCKVQWDEFATFDAQKKQVVKVLSVKPLRSRVSSSKIQHWTGSDGACVGQIYFAKSACQAGFTPVVGMKVFVEAIESDQGPCIWRAISIVPEDTFAAKPEDEAVNPNEEAESYIVEREKKLDVTKNITLKDVDFHSTKSKVIEITNSSSEVYVLLKWKVMLSRYHSQIIVEPFVSKRLFLNPGKTLKYTVTCKPRVLGSSRELLVFVFQGFQIARYVDLSVVDSRAQVDKIFSGNETAAPYRVDANAQKRIVQQQRQNQSYVAGVRPVKPPNFVPVKLPMFPIPDKMWDAVLGDSEQMIYGNEFQKALDRIEETVPCLSSPLKLTNYADRWHALLYIEEIQQNCQMRKYDMPKAFLDHSDGYLKITVEGLAEKRPSLMTGDRVYVKDLFNADIPEYEGYIHSVRGDNIYIKFSPDFHERYTGYDVKIEFHFSRTMYRRCHQAVNLALSHLGPSILFPNQMVISKPQVDSETLQNIRWCNEQLNPGQKEAVRNILEGTSRPMPYCIFGPPGTGKTVTVVEAVLQILNNIPDSRILIATPSNSSANLLTERLIKFESRFNGSLIRIIAHYMVESDTLPDIIKPYCATLDIATENTAKSKYIVIQSGIQMSCRSSLIGRHRVTIGTCGSLGSLAQMALPRGHFTHVIVDEAGQATEPEIMIPLTFLDKATGQIILAGDPMQLGPVVLSIYSRELGYDLSYLERLLERVPYQKDFEPNGPSGYDKRLITRLTYNYRSVPEVINLSSDIFYDSSLVPQVKNEDEWVAKHLRNINDLLPRHTDAELRGGIFMYGIKGTNARAADSPSWFNPQEATMILLHTCKLYKREVLPEQIGIITPYIAQIRFIKKLFDSTGTAQPKIGTVEEFQGQEREIVLLSTVRSSEALLDTDLKFSLGFVKSPKRLNVALTRAQVAVFLFGDPNLLSKDLLWNRVIEYVVKNGNYVGCNLPTHLERLSRE